MLALPAGVAIAGFGIGLSSVAATTLGTDVPADLGGVAAGTVNTAAQIGTALGAACLLVVATGAAHGDMVLARPVLGWACAAIAAAAGSLLYATRPADRSKGRAAAASTSDAGRRRQRS